MRRIVEADKPGTQGILPKGQQVKGQHGQGCRGDEQATEQVQGEADVMGHRGPNRVGVGNDGDALAGMRARISSSAATTRT